MTLMGQSAGATCAHLLTLSRATKGLYKRAFLMSGTAISSFYSPSPLTAASLSTSLISLLNINTTDAVEVHRQLVQMPVQKINEAHKILLDIYGLVACSPTVETAFSGVTRVLDDYPEALMKQGRGRDVPLIVGFTSAECEAFRPRFNQIDIVARVSKEPLMNVPVQVMLNITSSAEMRRISAKILQRYYDGPVTTQGFIKYCTDAFYIYPALRMVPLRAGRASAPLFLYEFSYENTQNPVRVALGTSYCGAAHIEDLTYVFRTNNAGLARLHSSPVHKDDQIKNRMSNFLVDYMHCSNPVCHDVSQWPSTTLEHMTFQVITQPINQIRKYKDKFKDMLNFYDNLSN